MPALILTIFLMLHEIPRYVNEYFKSLCAFFLILSFLNQTFPLNTRDFVSFESRYRFSMSLSIISKFSSIHDSIESKRFPCIFYYVIRSLLVFIVCSTIDNFKIFAASVLSELARYNAGYLLSNRLSIAVI